MAGAAASRYRVCRPAEFPVIEDINAQHSLRSRAQDCRRLIDKTHFAMAQQDVRYYLNGTLLETDGKSLRAVATDGHRLSWCEVALAARRVRLQQIILPRKGVLELQRLLDGEGDIEIAIGSNHIRVQIGEVRFTSKLIDGKFPEYGRVIPAQPPRIMAAPRDAMRAALQRTAILSNEKYRGVRLTFAPTCSQFRPITLSRKRRKTSLRWDSPEMSSRSGSMSAICWMLSQRSRPRRWKSD